MKKFIHLLRENLVVVSMITIMFLIAVGAVFTWLNKRKIKETTELRAQAEEVKERLDMIFSVSLRQIDLGLRGYALTKNDQLLSPMNNGIIASGSNLRKLDSLLRVQQLDTSIVKFERIRKGVTDYIAFSREMKKVAEQDSMRQFVEMLKQDKGYDLWVLFAPFNASHVAYENEVIQKA
ncbi:MAG TPA: CHASE3 domain-containing protein, partial [Cyclobacteriaceae bacterium]|nr:CHASE3 domain-containing protein [Cyclobacteriaceae bacterium]